MNRAYFSDFIRALSVCCLAVATFTGTRAKADQSLNVKLSLAKTKIVQGEPIVLNYALVNAGGAPFTVQVRVPYFPGSVAPESVERTQPAGVFATKQTLPFVVTKPDREYLQRKANFLARQAAKDTNYAHRVTLIESLFSMPAEAARFAWKQIVLEAANDDLVMQQLERLSTPTTAELLAEMAADVNRPAETREVARGTLRIMNSNANPALQPYLLQIFLTMDEEAPQILYGSQTQQPFTIRAQIGK